jgi:chromate transport protein ChrA
MTDRSAGLAEIARVFFKIGAMSYGGPAIMGIMQTEVQEKRQWISKPQFVEGLALVNMLPGPGATQLGIFLGHAKAGWLGGTLAGVCFMLPAFLIMLALAAAYAAFGALPAAQSAFYGIGPVVVGIFGASILTPQQFIDGLALAQLTPGPILMLAAFVGFKLVGVQGATVAATAIFLPSFVMMLSVLPLLKKMRDLQWLRAFMRGVGPAVIGALAVSLMQMAPHAAPDLFTWALLALTVGLILLRNVGPLPLMLGGGVIGLLVKGGVWERIEKFAR